MVRPGLALLLCLSVSAQGGAVLSPTAQALSPTVQALSSTAQGLSPAAQALSPPADVLAPMAARPAPPEHPPNARWEDFTAVTLLSAPFTAFWAVLGAVLVATVSQSRAQGRLLVPSMGTPELTGAAMVAATASVGIGLFSVQWGGSSRPASPTATATSPTPTRP